MRKPFSRNQTTPKILIGTRGLFGLRKVKLPITAWNRHQGIFGKTGKGKSSYIVSLASQLIYASNTPSHHAQHGVCVIDPHGDMVTDLIGLLASYPKERPWLSVPANRQRVLYIDPHSEYVAPLNPLLADNMHPYQIAQSVIEVMRRVWYDELKSAPRLVNMALYSLWVLTIHQLSIMELPLLLTHQDYRDRLLATLDATPVLAFWRTRFQSWHADAHPQMVAQLLKIDQIRAFWHDRFEKWPPRERPQMIESLLNKITELTMNPYIAPMLGAPAFLNPRHTMDDAQIVLINLAIDPRSKTILGSLFLTLYEMSALSRENLRKEKRTPCYLFVDEAQKFTAAPGSSQTFGEILSEARKYRLHLIFGTQGWDSIVSSARLAGAVEQVDLLSMFGTGAMTAKMLSMQTHQANPELVKHVVDDPDAQQRSHPQYHSVVEQEQMAIQQIQHRKARDILVKLPDTDALVELKTPTIPKPRVSWAQIERIKTALAQQSGRPRHELEREIKERSHSSESTSQPTAPHQGSDDFWDDEQA